MAGIKPVLRNGFYHAVGTVNGERVRKSLRTRDKRQAEELCAQLQARTWKRHTYGEEAVRVFEEAAVSYQETTGPCRFLAPLIRRFKGRLLGSIQPEEIRQAARVLYPTAKGSTWNRQAIVPTRAAINHAAGLGWCKPIKIKSFPTERPKRSAVDRQWIDAFLARCDADGLANLAAAVLFMWQSGTRVGEAVRVLPEHIDLQRRMIALERTKTGEWEIRHISRELMLRLANLPTEERKPIFGYQSRFGVGRRMKAVCRRAGIPFVPTHQAGRHSFATNALAMGATVKDVMEAGGWKSARLVLETYAHSENAGRSIADRFDENASGTACVKSVPHSDARSCIVLRKTDGGGS